MRFVFFLCNVVFSLMLQASEFLADSIRLETRKEGSFVIHRVDEKETLYSIARRYKTSVKQITEHNQIVDNRIEIGQIIEVLLPEKVISPDPEMVMSETIEGFHFVKEGETLYSISKFYQVKIKDLRKWNNLDGNNISLGMKLKVSKNASDDEKSQQLKDSTVEEVVVEKEVPSDPFEDFEKYLVQTGETLSSIATKIGVQLDSLRLWNNLQSDYLKIGQALLFKNNDLEKETSLVESNNGKTVRIDEDGFERIYEEGTASVIESMKTSRYLALHRTLPIGTNLEVRSLMNNRIVHVKVVGKLPDTGLNKNLLLRLSKPAYNQLGILDSKSKVEVSYYKR